MREDEQQLAADSLSAEQIDVDDIQGFISKDKAKGIYITRLKMEFEADKKLEEEFRKAKSNRAEVFQVRALIEVYRIND